MNWFSSEAFQAPTVTRICSPVENDCSNNLRYSGLIEFSPQISSFCVKFCCFWGLLWSFRIRVSNRSGKHAHMALVLLHSNTNTALLFQKDNVFKAVPTPLSPPPAPATPVTPSTPATPATPASSVSSGTPNTPNSISPSGIVKRKTGEWVIVCKLLGLLYFG